MLCRISDSWHIRPWSINARGSSIEQSNRMGFSFCWYTLQQRMSFRWNIRNGEDDGKFGHWLWHFPLQTLQCCGEVLKYWVGPKMKIIRLSHLESLSFKDSIMSLICYWLLKQILCILNIVLITFKTSLYFNLTNSNRNCQLNLILTFGF